MLRIAGWWAGGLNGGVYRPCRTTVSVQTIAHNRSGKAGWGMPGMPPARYVGRRFPILHTWDLRHPTLAHKRGARATHKRYAVCYVRVERSARLELAGYDQVSLLVVNGASASGTQ